MSYSKPLAHFPAAIVQKPDDVNFQLVLDQYFSANIEKIKEIKLKTKRTKPFTA